MEREDHSHLSIETRAGILEAEQGLAGEIAVDMGRDFAISLRKGDPVFLTMGGETLGFEPSDKDEEAGEACVPFFVNEAAYYEKGIAFMIAHQQQQPVRVLAAEPQCFDERVAKKSRTT